jgi:ribosomal protein S12 methylthiotransferase accessory factor
MVGRRLAGSSYPAALRLQMAAHLEEAGYLPPAIELTWAVSHFFIDVLAWVKGGVAEGDWHMVELDPVRLRMERHLVLPLPDRGGERTRTAGRDDPYSSIVDPLVGVVRVLEHREHHTLLPGRMKTVQAVACNMREIGPWDNDPVGGGSTFDDEVGAGRAAIGEVVERYCGNIVRPELLRWASYDCLVAAGERAIDPLSVVMFSSRQYSARGFPFTKIERGSNIHWVRGVSLTRNSPAWLPASLVYVNWYSTAEGDGDTPANGTFYPGISAGNSFESAWHSGLLEVIERHATMVWWLNQFAVPTLQLSPALHSLWPESNGRYRATLMSLPNEFGIPVVAGFVEDHDLQLLTAGFAARSDAVSAGRKAWTEAINLQHISSDLLQSDSVYNSVVRSGRLPDQGLKPWRSDRRYLESYRSDFRDVTNLICQSQLYLDPEAVSLIRSMVDVPSGTHIDDHPVLPSNDGAAVKRAVESQGFEIFCADITTSDMAAAGWHVVRTLVPGTVPNSPAAFPFLGQGRVQQAAVELGWRPTPLAESDLTSLPLPHA